jgi:hypothetical protein
VKFQEFQEFLGFYSYFMNIFFVKKVYQQDLDTLKRLEKLKIFRFNPKYFEKNNQYIKHEQLNNI